MNVLLPILNQERSMSHPLVPQSLYASNTPVGFPGDWKPKLALQPIEAFDYTTPNRPALAGWFQNKMWCAYRHGYGDNSIYYTGAGQSDVFSEEQKIPGTTTLRGPALAVFDDLLYCVYTNSDDSNQLYYTSFEGHDDSKWSTPQKIGNHSSAQGPALAVFKNQLWCVHTSNDSEQSLYYTAFNGQNWSGDIKFPDHCSATGPALAASDSQLVCVHRGAGTDESLWYTTYPSDGSDWSPDKRISVGIVGDYLYSGGDGPALAYDSGTKTFGLAYKGQDSENDTLLYYTVSGASDWSFPSRLHTFNSQAGPALVAYPFGPANKFMLMFRGINTET